MWASPKTCSSPRPRTRGLRVAHLGHEVWAYCGVFIRASRPVERQRTPPHYRMPYPPWTLDPSCDHVKEVKIVVRNVEKRTLKAPPRDHFHVSYIHVLFDTVAVQTYPRWSFMLAHLPACQEKRCVRESLMGLGPAFRSPDWLRLPQKPPSHRIRSAWNAVMQPQLSIRARQKARRRPWNGAGGLYTLFAG